jgi:hypothetical protein
VIVLILGVAALIIVCAGLMIRLALTADGRAAMEPELLVVDELAPESMVVFDAEPATEPRA